MSKISDAIISAIKTGSSSGTQSGGSSSGGEPSTSKKKKNKTVDSIIDVIKTGKGPEPTQPALEDFANANPLSDTVQSLTNQRDAIATPKYSDPMSQYMQRRGLAELDTAIQNQTQRERIETLPWNPITGTLLEPIGTATIPMSAMTPLANPQFMERPRPAEMGISELLVDAATKKSNPVADAQGQDIRTQRAATEAARKLPTINEQIEDTFEKIGMTSDPAERQRLDSQLSDLQQQKKNYESMLGYATPEIVEHDTDTRTPEEISKEVKEAKTQKRTGFWETLGNLNASIAQGEAGRDAMDQAVETSAARAESAEKLRNANKELRDVQEEYRLSDEQRTWYKARVEKLEEQGILRDAFNIEEMSQEELEAFKPKWDEYQAIQSALANDSRTNWERFTYGVEAAGVGTGSSFANSMGLMAEGSAAQAKAQIYQAMALVPKEQRAQLEQALADLDDPEKIQEAKNFWYDISDRLDRRQQELMAEANKNATSGQQTFTNIVRTSTEMAEDALFNTLTGANGLWFMGARVYGQSAAEARRAGADENEQRLYGLVHAGTEVLTEKMFDVFGFYGGGKGTELGEQIIANVTGNKTMAKALTVLFALGGEPTEELVSGIADPATEFIINGEKFTFENLASKYDADWAAETGEAMFDAAILGAFGGVAKVVGNQVMSADGRVLEIGSPEWRESILSPEARSRIEAAGMDPTEVEDALADAQREQIRLNEDLKPSQIVRNEEQRAAFEASHPGVSLEGLSNTEAEKLVARTLYEEQRKAEQEKAAPAATAQATENAGNANANPAADDADIPKDYISPQNTLTENDLDGYLKTGNRNNKSKQKALAEGKKILLTSPREIISYIRDAIKNGKKNVATAAYGKVDSRLAEDVQSISNGKTNITGSYLEFIPDDLKHAYDKHHTPYQKGDIGLSERDFDLIPQYLETYDKVESVNTYENGRTIVCVSKALPDGRIIIIEVVSRSRNSLQFKTAYGVSEEKYNSKDWTNNNKSQANTRGSKNSIISLRDAQALIGEAAEAVPENNVPQSSQKSNSNVGSSPVIDALVGDSSPSSIPNEGFTSEEVPGYNTASTEDSNNDDDNNPPSGPSSPGGTSAPGTVPAPTGLKRSQTESHTLQGNTNGGEQDSLFYVPVTEKQTMMAAAARVKQDISGEMSRLIDKESWDSADVDTAMTIYGILQADGVRNHDFSAAQAWGKVIQPRGTATAQALQAFSKWTRTGQAVFTDAITEINENSTLSEEQKNQVLSDLHGFADRFDTLTAVDENGNTTVDGKDLRQLILDLNKFRKTGTFNPKTFGKVLNQVQDTEWLQEFALRQLMAVSADYTNNPSLAKQLKTWQVNSQLSRLGTFFRNIGGNMTFGVQDTLAQDFFGYAIDSLVSKKTGRKEVGFDKGWMSSTARKAAADALYKSILEVSGDVDMTGEATRYGNTTNRTNKMTGNGFEQFMSRWEQLLGYSLTSSDRFSRGQIEASIAEGLMKANKGKMTQEQANEIAKQVADYRLFQNNGTTAQFSRKIHDALNTIGVKGQNGESFGLGDLINPYPGVPANLGVKALEYSPANIIKGGIELHKILSDYKHGVDVDYGRQNQAVMDMARGMSGVPAIALLATLFKRGVIKNADDEDDLDAKAQKTAEGQTGVQINLSAMKRTLEGKSSEWQSGDDLMSIGWLEPLNAFMAIASMVADSAEDETLWSMAKQYPQAYLTGSLQSILDMPVMSNLANMVDAYNYSNAEALGGKIGDMALQGAGDAISGMLPAPIGQFAKATDPMQRSTKGDSNFETVLNGIMANIPGLRGQLDPKLDAYGNEREYSGTDTQRWLNTFVLPGAISEYSQNDIQKLTDDLYKSTGDAAVFPDRKPPSSLKFGTESVKLSTEQQDAYQKKAGETIQELVDRTTHTSAWNTLTDEEKVSALDGIYKYAEYIAKKDFADANEYKMSDSMYSKYEKLDDPAEGIIWNNKWSEATANGEQDYVAMDKVISEMDRMSDDVREMMENKDYVQKLEDASALGIGSRDFFITHDFLSGISKAEKEGTALDYDAIDKGIQQYAKVVDSDEKADVFSSYFSKGDELAEAAKSGMKSEEWFKYYHKYKEISDLTKDEEGNNISANAKHDEFNNFVDMSDLSPEQKEMLKGQFTFFTGYTVDNTTYDKMVRGGADPEAAYRWVQEQGDLVPTGDHTSVTSNQKAFVILNDNSLDPADRIEAVLNTDGSVVKPNQGEMARWLSSNFSYSEAKYYWRQLQSKFGWSSKSTYEKALKK